MENISKLEVIRKLIIVVEVMVVVGSFIIWNSIPIPAAVVFIVLLITETVIGIVCRKRIKEESKVSKNKKD